jgi:hypothetical protein
LWRAGTGAAIDAAALLDAGTAAAYPARQSTRHDEAGMGWATAYIARLRAGETVQFRPRGASMKGKIESGQLCTVAPVTDAAALAVGDIVLCKVGGNEYLHLIKAIQGQRFQIGNNRGFINGWIGPNAIFGRCTTIAA